MYTIFHSAHVSAVVYQTFYVQCFRVCNSNARHVPPLYLQHESAGCKFRKVRLLWRTRAEYALTGAELRTKELVVRAEIRAGLFGVVSDIATGNGT